MHPPTEPTEAQARSAAYSVCKRVYNWQEKNGIYAFDSELCMAETGVMIAPTFEMEFCPEGQTAPRMAVFVNDGTCAENEGVCGAYVLRSMGNDTWRVEKRAKSKARSPKADSPAEDPA